MCPTGLSNFNPRSREGSDLVAGLRRSTVHNFNPRSREGSDYRILMFVGLFLIFQSTLP